MDRKKLVDLFRKGMQYPPGKHRFWISRYFEIHVKLDSTVELDEYEGFSSEDHKQAGKKMFHVGRSVLHLKDGTVIEQDGEGWRK